MKSNPLISVIINNYNYEPYLKKSIKSALNQTYKNTEVIVVDDGSTDGSRKLIASYSGRIIPVLKQNSGQTSAFNAGFAASQGEIIIFLDADDTLFPSAAKEAIKIFLKDKNIAKVHWPMLIVDKNGENTGKINGPGEDAEGNLKNRVIQNGPFSYISPSTSGNAWNRQFLKKIFPLPEIEKITGFGSAGADETLSALAALYGIVKRIKTSQGTYRIHGKNDRFSRNFSERLLYDSSLTDYQCQILNSHCRQLGIKANLENWKRNNWWQKILLSVKEIEVLIKKGTAIILADGNTWGVDQSFGYKALPFSGPSDNQTAIRELERLRKQGAKFLVIAWPIFWWASAYPKFFDYLNSCYFCLLKNERLVIFKLGGDPKYQKPCYSQNWDQDYKEGKWDYLKSFGERNRYAVISACLFYFKSKPAILDIGCGQGILINKIKFGRYFGIDVSKTAIQSIPQKKNLFLKVADANKFETNKKFDAIIFNETLYYFKNWKFILNKYQKLMENNGIFVISMYDDRAIQKIWNFLDKKFNNLYYSSVFGSYPLPWKIGIFKLKS